MAFAILTALVMNRTLLQGSADHFFMEMPVYQLPGLRNILLNTWGRLKSFILGAGKLIVLIVMLINVVNSLGTDGSFGNQNTEKSVLSAGARAITPVFAPMGIEPDNWPATVGILSGVLAKEVVVGTLDALCGQLDEPVATAEVADAAAVAGASPQSLIPCWADWGRRFATIPGNLQDAVTHLGDPLGLGVVNEEQAVGSSTFTAMNHHFDGKIGAFAYLLFILMYFPCVAATGAMLREVGARWTVLAVSWSTGLGYAAAVLFYQLATLPRHPLASLVWSAAVLAALGMTLWLFRLAGQRREQQGSGWQTGMVKS
ncbi:MAG: nucleoside recognition domain-containing protein [Thiolinea sp.]